MSHMLDAAHKLNLIMALVPLAAIAFALMLFRRKRPDVPGTHHGQTSANVLRQLEPAARSRGDC